MHARSSAQRSRVGITMDTRGGGAGSAHSMRQPSTVGANVARSPRRASDAASTACCAATTFGFSNAAAAVDPGSSLQW